MVLTIAVITRKRPENLKECLASIYSQATDNFCVVVVDNDENKTAYPVYEHFARLNSIPVFYRHEPRLGYSRARNCALKNCKTRFLGFVDDDCILDKDWAVRGLDAISKHRSAYVAGQSREMHTDRLFAEVENYVIFNNGKTDFYDKDSLEMMPDKLDTKNVIMDCSLLKSFNIEFDNRFNQYGGEDVDIGFQLKYKHQKGYYVEDMILYHKEKADFRKFLHKAFCYGYNGYNLHRKWNHRNECSDWTNYDWYSFWNIWNSLQIFRTRNSSLLKILHFLILTKIFNFFYLQGVRAGRKSINDSGSIISQKPAKLQM